MKIDQLEDFIVVAKRQNITKSAAELHTSQPSLSTRIAALEREVGCPLFERSNNGIKLNESGHVFLGYAQQIADLYREGAARSRQARTTASVRIALDPSSDLARALPRLPAVSVRIVELGINSSAVDAVASGEVDLALDSDYTQIPELNDEADELGLSYIPAGKEASFIAMMAHHPLANNASLRRADLDGQTVVVNSGVHFDRWSKAVQRMIGPDIRLRFRLNQTESHSDASLTDFGNALYICGSGASRRILERRRDVVVRDMLDGAPLTFPCALLCRTADYRNAHSPIRAIVEALLDALGTTDGA